MIGLFPQFILTQPVPAEASELTEGDSEITKMKKPKKPGLKAKVYCSVQ